MATRVAHWAVGDQVRMVCSSTDGAIAERLLSVERVTELTCGCTRLQMRRPGPAIVGSAPWVAVTDGRPGCYCGAERVRRAA